MSDLSGSLGAGAQLASQAMGTLVSARLAAMTEPPEEISCQINPNEFSIQKNANMFTSNQVGETTEGVTSYNGPSTTTMNVSLLFDDTALTSAVSLTPPVPVAVAMLMSWTEPTPASELEGPPMPPMVDFSWGATQHFIGNVEGVHVSYKLFRLGVAVRAEVDLTMRAVSTPLPMTNPTSGGLVPRRSRTVVQGDTLASIAHRTYGRPSAWRSLAEANGIDDPTRVPVGTELLLPNRSEVDIPHR